MNTTKSKRRLFLYVALCAFIGLWTSGCQFNNYFDFTNPNGIPEPTPTAPPTATPTGVLVGEWLFNGNANDTSGYGNNGTVNGTILATDRFGNANKAYYFDGTNNIEIPNSSFMEYPSMTICAWMKDQSDGTFQASQAYQCMIVSKHVSTVHKGFFLEYAYETPDIAYYVGHEGPPDDSKATYYTTTLDSQWHFITGVYDNGSTNIYVDGVLRASDSISGMTHSPANIRIGSLYSGGPWMHYWKGIIDDVRIYNRALSSPEIDALYHEGGVPQGGLVGEWRFSGSANDTSGNSNNGTVNGATLATDRFGNANSAYSFDGVNDYAVVNNSANLCLSTGTFAAWAKPYPNSHGYLLCKSIYGTYENYSIGMDATMMAVSASINGPYYRIASNYIPQSGVWTFVVGVYDGAQLSIYVNGVIDNYTAISGSLTQNSHPLYFGCDYNNSGSYYTGIIDDVRIYNRALSDIEILALYHEGGW